MNNVANDIQKMLKALINGQSELSNKIKVLTRGQSELSTKIEVLTRGQSELSDKIDYVHSELSVNIDDVHREIQDLRTETKEGFKKVNDRVDMLGKSLAYLEDDAPILVAA